MVKTMKMEMDPPPKFPSKQEIQAEFFKAGAKLVNLWKDNLRAGEGADGTHGRPYVNTGEAVGSVQMYPETPGSDEYIIFSDRIQVLIAEVGRAPGTYPPYEPISQWVHEQLGIKKKDPKHYAVVRAIQQSIKDNGLEPFAPMEKAVIDLVEDLEENLGLMLEIEKNK